MSEIVSGEVKKPLVTFALFAYNQEKYIREAVEGAFSQTYEPLEIILSDDCSSDRTFEIMKEMAAGYKGPHRVIARKTQTNRGSLLHVSEVAEIAEGELLILAAGDDVSKANRSDVLVTAWQETGAWGLCSRFDRIDASGLMLETAVESAVLDGRGFKNFFYENEGPIRIVHGCASAYDKLAFRYLQINPTDFILSEDGAMSVLLNLLGKKIVNLNDSLVLYRESPGSLTNNQSKTRLSYSRIINDEKRIEWFAQSQANRCELFLRMNEYLGEAQARKMNVAEVRIELRRQLIRAEWKITTFSQRLSFALQDRSSMWAWPRLFGLNIFYIIKWLSRRF
jgi:glycosyltransferase involved in cell wall biosynthesis